MMHLRNRFLVIAMALILVLGLLALVVLSLVVIDHQDTGYPR